MFRKTSTLLSTVALILLLVPVCSESAPPLAIPEGARASELVPAVSLDFCIELDVDAPCVVKVAGDCEESCDAAAVEPACVALLGARASARSMAVCRADYQTLCVSQCEESGGGFCGGVWVGADVCIDLG